MCEPRPRVFRVFVNIKCLTDRKYPSQSGESENLPKFEGACLGIGARRCLIGHKQAEAYCEAQASLLGPPFLEIQTHLDPIQQDRMEK